MSCTASRLMVLAWLACLAAPSAPPAVAQDGESSVVDFEARRRELREAYRRATTPAEKKRILDEFARLGLEPPAPGPGPDDVVDAANRLVSEFGHFYGVQDPWRNLDPDHALPANVRLGGLRGRWKCNLFGGNALWLAGFDPPRYGNRGRGEYPNANQWYKWSDEYAARHGNKVHFQLVGEVAVEALPESDRRAAVLAVLRQARPGDFIMVDHVGEGVADGGHTRVVVKNAIGDGEGFVSSAMASYESALVRDEGVDAFVGEERIWILRPNRPRTP